MTVTQGKPNVPNQQSQPAQLGDASYMYAHAQPFCQGDFSF